MRPRNRIESGQIQLVGGARRLVASAALTVALGCLTGALAACAPEEEAVPAAGTAAPDVASSAPEAAVGASGQAAVPPGFRVPVDFKPECAYLGELKEPPADLTLERFYDCLTDDSFRALDRQYRRSRKVDSGAPTLEKYVARHGKTLARNKRHERATAARVQPGIDGDGRAEESARVQPGIDGDGGRSGSSFASGGVSYGLNPLTGCGSASCVSTSVPVVGTSRTIGYRPAVTQGGTNPGLWPGDPTWRFMRFVDGVDYGTYPDARQSLLSDPELVAAGCGPIAGINLLDWWNIPIIDRSNRVLTGRDERAAFMAQCMGTLDGTNFTDDENLWECLNSHVNDMYNRRLIPSRPGSYASYGNPAAFKRMMNEVALGHPAIALYSTGSTSMHWALVTGLKDGMVQLANANPMPLARFYDEWDDWATLGWAAQIGVELYVDQDTFYVLTGFGTNPEPARYAPRASTTSLPAYASGTTRHSFRYCMRGPDEISAEAEGPRLASWPNEPNASTGYCLFDSPRSWFDLQRSPLGGVAIDGALRTFITSNPGVRGQWWGKDGAGSWSRLSDILLRDVAAGANIPAPSAGASITELQFLVHTADFAQIRGPVADFAAKRPLLFYHAPTGAGYMSTLTDGGVYASRGALPRTATYTHVAGAANGTHFFYDASTGWANVSRWIAPTETYSNVGPVRAPAAGFTHLAAANQGGLFFYNANTQAGATAVVDTAGRYSYVSALTGLGSWTHVTGTSNGGLFFYNASNGTAATARLDAAGRYSSVSGIAGLATGWTHIVGASEGSLFFYNSGSGLVATARLDAAGRWNHVSVLSILPGWTKIAGASNGGILFFNSSGAGYTGAINAAGNYRSVSPLSGFGNWSHVVAL